MNRLRQTTAAGILGISMLATGIAPAAAAPSCEPYCDDATTRVVNGLDGRGGGGWLATTLDSNGYRGKRWAEITTIPAGHGKRSVGIIHVPRGAARQVQRALGGAWFAQKHTLFVLPLNTRFDTEGGRSDAHRTAARWAAGRLGDGWKVKAP